MALHRFCDTQACDTTLDMREWVREQFMRRRSRRAPNESESTGKIGQELPTDQLAPLRPAYPESVHEEQNAGSAPAELPQTDVTAEEPGLLPSASEMLEEPAVVEPQPELKAEVTQPTLVVETQPESLGTSALEATAVSPRSPRGYVILTIGLPGSGKTTWYKRRGVQPLSSDMLRNILFDDITEQRYQGLVFSTLRSLLRARLIAKMPWNYVDATNLSPHERRQWIKMAKSFGYEVQAVFFDVPLAVCLERNSKRDRQVTDEMMHKLAERLRPPAFKEGFDKITVVRVKGATGPNPVAAPPSAEAEQGEQQGAESAPEAAVEG
ncbi:MAG: AAA family ATPase [Janthinobacterium lividum]